MAKYTLPRFPGAGSFGFSRSLFLSGAIPVGLAVGQPPLPSPDYVPPSDWPAAGTLLRVPQVAKVTFNNPPIFQGTSDPGTIGESRFDVVAVSPVTPSEGSPATVANRFGVEYRRVRSVVENVSEALSLIRPGVTFLEWVEMSDDSTETGLSTAATDISEPSILQFARPPIGAEFFGVDFLHINCGVVSLADGDIIDNWAGSNIDPDSNPSATPSGMIGDEFYVDRKSELLECIPKFRRYAASLWPTKIDWSYLAGISSEPGGDLFLQQLQWANQISASLMNAIADDMSEHGFALGGFTREINEDRLMSLVASHFGFDPETGRDLV